MQPHTLCAHSSSKRLLLLHTLLAQAARHHNLVGRCRDCDSLAEDAPAEDAAPRPRCFSARGGCAEIRIATRNAGMPIANVFSRNRQHHIAGVVLSIAFLLRCVHILGMNEIHSDSVGDLEKAVYLASWWSRSKAHVSITRCAKSPSRQRRSLSGTCLARRPPLPSLVRNWPCTVLVWATFGRRARRLHADGGH